MGRLKKKTIIFGSSSDIGKKIKQVLNQDNIIELNSKDLDLSNLEKAKNFKINIYQTILSLFLQKMSLKIF